MIHSARISGTGREIIVSSQRCTTAAYILFTMKGTEMFQLSQVAEAVEGIVQDEFCVAEISTSSVSSCSTS